MLRLRAFADPATCNELSSFSPTTPTEFSQLFWRNGEVLYLEFLVNPAAVSVNMRKIKRAEIGVEVLVDKLLIDAEVVSVGS